MTGRNIQIVTRTAEMIGEPALIQVRIRDRSILRGLSLASLSRLSVPRIPLSSGQFTGAAGSVRSSVLAMISLTFAAVRAFAMRSHELLMTSGRRQIGQ